MAEIPGQRSPHLHEPHQSNSDGISLHGETILVVDSQLPMIQLIKDILRRGGATTFYDTDNFTTALRLLKKHKPGLVICDFEVRDPKHKGQTLLVEARRQQLLSHATAFIYLLSESSERMMNAALEDSPDDWMSKPVNSKELLDKVLLQLQQRQLLEPALLALDQGQRATAIDWLQHHLPALQKSSSPGLWMRAERLLGRMLLKNNQLTEAEQHYRQMIRHSHPVPWGHLGLAICLHLQDRNDEARDTFSALLPHPFLAAEAYDWLSRMHCCERQFELAQMAMSLACQHNPQSAFKQSQLGFVAFMNGQNGLAEKAFRSVAWNHRNLTKADAELYQQLVWDTGDGGADQSGSTAYLPSPEAVGQTDGLMLVVKALEEKEPDNAQVQLKVMLVESVLAQEELDDERVAALAEAMIDYYLMLDAFSQLKERSQLSSHFRFLGRDFHTELAAAIAYRASLSAEELSALRAKYQRKRTGNSLRDKILHQQQRQRSARQLRQMHLQQLQDAEKQVLHDIFIDARRDVPVPDKRPAATTELDEELVRQVRESMDPSLSQILLDELSREAARDDPLWVSSVQEAFRQRCKKELEYRIERNLLRKKQAMAAVHYLPLLPVSIQEKPRPHWSKELTSAVLDYARERYEPAFFSLLKVIKQGGGDVTIQLNMVQAGIGACREGSPKAKQVINICLFYLRPLMGLTPTMALPQRQRFTSLTQALRMTDEMAISLADS